MRVGSLRLKAQLFCGDEPAIGPGRAELLEAIAATGSISGASRRTGISYRKTWLMVDAMNRCFTDRLVEAGNKGAALTDSGHAALRAFRRLEAMIADVSSEEIADLAAMLRPAPLPPG